MNQLIQLINTTIHFIEKSEFDVKPKIYFKYGVGINQKNPKFEVRDHVQILKYKILQSAKICTLNWSEQCNRKR